MGTRGEKVKGRRREVLQKPREEGVNKGEVNRQSR
jgi:hypothetical protein